MNLIFSFIFSVLASIVAYYICKWLDRKVASLGLNPPFQNGQKAPEVQLRGFCCINHEYISSFIAYRHYSICSSGMQYSQNENLMIYLWLFSTQGKMAYCGISATLFIPVMRSALDNFHAVSVYLKHYPVFLVNVNAPISCKVSA